MELYIYRDKGLFHELEAKKDDIESKLGYKIDWQELPTKKAARIIVTKNGDYQDESQHEELLKWLLQKAEEFTKVFKKLL